MRNDQERDLLVTVRDEIDSTFVLSPSMHKSVWAAAHDKPAALEAVAPPLFVSYAREDFDTFVVPLIHRLQEHYTLWVDQHNIIGGEPWKSKIDEGIRKCVLLLAILTPRSVDVKREWILYEQKEALRLFAPIVPVMLEECDIPRHLKHLQVVDLTAIPYADNKNRDQVAKGRRQMSELRLAIDHHVRKRGRKWLCDETPRASRAVIGRERELRAVHSILHHSEAPVAISSDISAVTVAVVGMAGIGKTVLVEELVRRIGPRYPGGVIFEPRGRNPDDVQAVLRRWAHHCGEIPEGVLRPEHVRNMFSQVGEFLVVIDDVWPGDLANVKQLLMSLPPRAKCLLTSRFSEGVDAIGAQLFTLEGFSQKDGVAFLRNRLSDKKGRLPSRAVLRRLHGVLGGHVLSLELSAGRVEDNARFDEQVERLERRINEANLGDIELDVPELNKDAKLLSSLEESFAALRLSDKESNRTEGRRLHELFPLLGVFAEEAPFDASAAAAVWGLDSENRFELAEELLDALVGFAVVDVQRGRFIQHTIQRAYARYLLKLDPDVERASCKRHFEHYAAIVRLLPIVKSESWQEYGMHRANIEHAAEQAYSALNEAPIYTLSEPEAPARTPLLGDESYLEGAVSIAESMSPFALFHTTLPKSERWFRAGLAAARAMGRRDSESLLLLNLGATVGLQGNYDLARRYLEQSQTIPGEQADSTLDLFISVLASVLAQTFTGEGEQLLLQTETLMDPKSDPILVLMHSVRMIVALNFITDYSSEVGRELVQGLEMLLSALREAQIYEFEIMIFTLLSRAYLSLEDRERARELLERFQSMLELEDIPSLPKAVLLNGVGNLCRTMSDYRQALEYYQQALNSFREIHAQLLESATLMRIAAVYTILEQPQQALDHYEEALLIWADRTRRREEAFTLTEIGVVYLGLDQYERALGYLEKSLTIREEIGNPVQIVETLRMVSLAYSKLNRTDQAVVSLKRALAIYRELGSRGKEAGVFRQIGTIYRQAQQYERALEYLEPALATSKEIEDKVEVATTLEQIGQVFHAMENYKSALDYWEQALPTWDELGDKKSLTATLANVGSIYRHEQQFDEAEQVLQRALAISRELGDQDLEVATLTEIARSYQMANQSVKAIETYRLALALGRKLGNRSREVTVLIETGAIYASIGQSKRALDTFEEALPIYREMGDRDMEAKTLTNLGAIHSRIWGPKAAIEYYQRALSLQEEIGGRKAIGKLLRDLGQAYHESGQREEALDFYERSLPYLEEAGNTASLANTLSNIGALHAHAEQPERGLEYSNRAAAIFKSMDADPSARTQLAFTLLNIGGIYEALGQRGQALRSFKRALSVLDKHEDRVLEERALVSIANLYRATGKRVRALEYLERALSVVEKTGDRTKFVSTLTKISELLEDIGDRDKLASALNKIGLSYLSAGKWDQALDVLKKARQIYRELDDRTMEATTLVNIGAAYERTQDPSESVRYYEPAIEILEQLDDRVLLATTLNNIGMAMDKLARRKEALDYLERAILIYEKEGNQALLAATLENTSDVQFHTGQIDEALRSIERALSIIDNATDKERLARSLVNQGMSLGRLEKREEALRCFERALSIQEDLGNHTHIAITLNNIGGIYSGSDEVETRLEYFERALGAAEAGVNPQLTILLLTNIAFQLHNNPDLGRQAEAVPLVAKAIKIMEQTGLRQDASGRTLDELRSQLDNLQESSQDE